MANGYQFSQSSLKLVELCIAAANEPGTKWIELFKPRSKEVIVKHDETCFYSENTEDTIIILPLSNDEDVKNTQEQQLRQSELDQVKRIGAILESTPSNKLNYLMEQCNFEHLLPDLAEILSSECMENIFEDILKNFDNRNEKILLHFFPIYIKRENSSDALNLLVNVYKIYPNTLITLIQPLFMSTDIPNRLLEQFFIAVDQKAHTQFLQSILIQDLSTEVFIHHLNAIIYLYKSCSKTFENHKFVLNGLLKSAQLCQDDKNYGRCLLTFFQGLNENNAQISKQSLNKLLDCHKTTFKRPCQAILSNHYRNY